MHTMLQSHSSINIFVSSVVYATLIWFFHETGEIYIRTSGDAISWR